MAQRVRGEPPAEELRATLDGKCEECCQPCKDGGHIECTSRRCNCEIKRMLLAGARTLRLAL